MTTLYDGRTLPLSQLPRPAIAHADLPLTLPALHSIFDAIDAIVALPAKQNRTSGRHTPDKTAASLRFGSVAGSPAQTDFYWRIATNPTIQTVCEVGFNAGHSTAIWLTANPTLLVYSFDLFVNSPRVGRYGLRSAAALQQLFQNRLTTIKGNSARTIPEWVASQALNSSLRCDLVRRAASIVPAAAQPITPHSLSNSCLRAQFILAGRTRALDLRPPRLPCRLPCRLPRRRHCRLPSEALVTCSIAPTPPLQVHIDGLHSYKGVVSDFLNLYPMSGPNTLYLFDDQACSSGELGARRARRQRSCPLNLRRCVLARRHVALNWPCLWYPPLALHCPPLTVGAVDWCSSA